MKTIVHKSAIAALGFTTILFFQNCGHSVTSDGSNDAAPVELHEQSLAVLGSFTTQPNVSYYVKPVAIKFGNVGNYPNCAYPIDDPPTNPVFTTNTGSSSSSSSSSSTGAIAPGVPHPMPPQCLPYYYSDYSLNLLKLQVEDAAGNVVLTLDAAQIALLKTILTGSVVAGANDFSKFPLPLCSAVNLPDYAVIVTNDGRNIALKGLCDGKDLYNLATGKPAGLREFLQSLYDQINPFTIGII